MNYEEISNLALRRGIYFPTAEIYAGAPSGFWEYGPVGERLRQKIVELWRKELVLKEEFVEIYGSQILPRSVFEASGHLESFNDPIVQCKNCHSFYRADKIVEEVAKENVPESLPIEKFDELIKKHGIKCPKCGKKDFAETKKFNMMIRTDIGAMGNHECYLRPETCQNIFLNFSRVQKVARKSLPLGIAQVGASFRNEIAPRNSLIRERELRQMEVEIFFNPKKIDEIENWEEVENYKIRVQIREKEEEISCKELVEKKIVSGKLVAYYLAKVQQLYEKYGFPIEKMRFRSLSAEARAFYALETWDFEVLTSLGWVEIIANNYRGEYDLKGHSEGSKKDLSIVEEGSTEKFLPHVFEISAGVDRTLFAILDNSFRKEKRGTEERIYLSLPSKIATYLVSVFPLVNKDGLGENAKEIFNMLIDSEIDAIFDGKGSIGRRYARTDEIGVPFNITVDYQTKEDGTVTVRERDSMKQIRVPINNLVNILTQCSRKSSTSLQIGNKQNPI